jgi:hypothetical protein
VRDFTFPRTPPKTLDELWAAVLTLLPELARRVRRDQAIGTTETPIAHGLGFAPQAVRVLPTSDVRVWETQAPDSRFVYLRASGACTASLEFVP